MDLLKSMAISASGMRAQGRRMQVAAENLANANSISTTPGGEPYRRKLVSFKNELDKDMGVHRVQVSGIERDKSEFGMRHEPGHPAADENGYVRTPNVNGLIETMDIRQAQRSYEANLNAIEAARKMLMRTIELLK